MSVEGNLAETDAQAPPPKTGRNKRKIVVADGPHMVLDLSWGDLMNEHTQKKVVSQVSMAYSFDKMSPHPIPIMISSVDQRWRELLHRLNAFSWNKDVAKFETKPFWEVVPIDKIVYLTPDTDEVCTSLDKDKYYVIGCILDHNSKKGATKELAMARGIKTQRLPIPETITMIGRHVLTINHVAEAMVRVAGGMEWGDAFVAGLPQRKEPKKLVVADDGAHVLAAQPEPETKPWFCNIA